MSIEIERKFLILSNDFQRESNSKSYIKQGFLNSHKERVVRVRIKNNQGYLTIKGPSNKSGTTRFEWEKKISIDEAKNLFQLCEKGIIEKYRYEICFGKHTYEIDEFLGDNEGLIIAEIELSNENEEFYIPKWLGKEVTGIEKYYNSNLSKNPYSKWQSKKG